MFCIRKEYIYIAFILTIINVSMDQADLDPETHQTQRALSGENVTSTYIISLLINNKLS